ncbi:MAG: MBOAT family O-acyltransferase, partial [Lachnospiraceae bacterium]|nr:MBOAT family O-acyltransferase [Lachnospiraceae bacterium]
MAVFSLHYIVFIGIAVLLYYLVPKKYQWVILLLASIAFYYISGGLKAGLFITVTIITTFCGALAMNRISESARLEIKASETPLSRDEKKQIRAKAHSRKHKVFLATLLINLDMLIVLKYAAFFTANADSLLSHLGVSFRIPQVGFILPLGISFYTFQTTGYLIDVYNDKYQADRNIFKFALFASWFPQIIQGPISRHDALAPQLYDERSFNVRSFRTGIYRMLWGYFKKMVIAERCAIIVNEIILHYADHSYSGLTVFLGVLFYGIQMYGDFAGGIDIIIGASELFGVSLAENFKRPYMALNVAEFWQRWHITLGSWMKDYVFYPIALSGTFAKMQKNLKKSLGPYIGKVIPTTIASFIVFVLVGIWHGASWRYVIFGIYHATLVSGHTLLERVYGKMRDFLHIDGKAVGWKCFCMVRTTFLVTIGRYFDCTPDTATAFQMLRKTFTVCNPWVLTDGSLFKLGVSEREFSILMMAIILQIAVDI